jgi:subtilisin-like proprotein convertase family protein
MRPLSITPAAGRFVSAALTALLLLGLLPVAPARKAHAFMPSNVGSWGLAASPLSHTHISMTEDVFKELSREFFNLNKLSSSMRKAMGQITDADAEVDKLQQLGGDQFDKSASHFDGEAFPESQNRLMVYSVHVQNLLKNNLPEEARWYLGQALHTLQDFYSHSNWVELGNTGAFDRLGVRGDPLNIRPPVTHDTCLNCERNDCPDCIEILTTNQLTTGYYGGDDRPKPHAFKCSHGGRMDSSSRGAYGAGLNKDTRACPLSPHWQLHEQAVAAAKEATRLYIRRIKEAVGVERAKLLFGVGPTLAFAVDTTGSMGSVIAQVRQQSIQIVDSRLGTDEEPSKYVLVPFNDPEVGPVVETTDADEFKNALAALTASGGGDCPEPSMSGTLQALNATDAGGNLLIFTDATASDTEMSANVSALAQSKNVQVSPLLFGSCSPIDPAYVRLAKESGGQLFLLARAEAGSVTRLADFNVRSNLVNLLSVSDSPAALPRSYTVPVDSTLSRITFSVSGGPGVVVTRPDGTTLLPGDPGVSVVQLGFGAIYSVTAPAPGEWAVRLNNFNATGLLDDYTISVSGESDLSFDSFRFIESGGRPGHEGYFPIKGFPVAGQPAAVEARLTHGPAASAQFELRAPGGALLHSLTVEEVPHPEAAPVFKEYFGQLTLAAGDYLAYVRGLDLNGKPYQRVLPGLIRPQTLKVTTPGLRGLAPGRPSAYAIQVTNYGPADTFSVVGADDQNFIRALSPETFSLGAGQTREVAVELLPPAGAPVGTLATLTFTAQSTGASAANNRGIVTTILAPGPDLRLGDVAATPAAGDGDAFIEPNEVGRLAVGLENFGVVEAAGVTATLATTTPGVSVVSGHSAYPDIFEGQGAENLTPFAFRLAPGFPCGLRADFTLTVTHAGLDAPKVFRLSAPTGQPGALNSAGYAGPPVAIPDGSAAGVQIPFEVAGVAGGASDLDFRFDGGSCTSAGGATTVGLEHTWVGDLIVQLTSPQGTTVTLLNRPGDGPLGSSGNNFCSTVLDDEGGLRPIDSITASDAPHTGSFTPDSPLAAFRGEDPNGTWRLTVSDLEPGDTGRVRAFSLLVRGSSCDSPVPADAEPPATAASVSPAPNAAGWHNADASVQLAAADEAGGSGVRDITFEAAGAQGVPPTTVAGNAAQLLVTAEGTTTVSFRATDQAGNVEPTRTFVVRLDKTPPAVAVAAPSGSYLLNQTVAALFGCEDLLSGVRLCEGTLASGAPVDTSAPGPRVFSVSAEDVAGNAATHASPYAVAYGVRLLYDAGKAHQSGSTIPVKLQLTDAHGANVSAAGVVVTALQVVKLSDYAPGEVEDAGNANPDDNFRFTGAGGDGGYVFNLKTTGLTRGTYALVFKAGADPTTHAAQFQIK